MFWRKQNPPKIKKKSISKNDVSLIKPSPKRHYHREKRIDLKIPCYIYDDAEDFFLQTTTINLSKTGLLVRALDPIKSGTEIHCLLSRKTNLTKTVFQASKYVMRGTVVRLEKVELLYHIAIHITFGRIDPSSFLIGVMEDKHWWTRHWQ